MKKFRGKEMRHWLDRPLSKKEIKELEEWDRRTSFMLNGALMLFVVCCSIAVIKAIF